MNKTFHSIWNASKQAYVAAAETVSAKGKPTSGVKVAAVLAGLMGSLLGTVAHAQTAPPPNALPTGGQVSAGQASISASGANMVIQQSSNRAAINWQSFNVGSNAQVQFNQPSASSVTLNRVMSADPSQIFGRITANGQVILTNPAGVYFGKDARVDVGGLVATTHGMSDADFMAGKNRYERNGTTASVVNEGELKAALGGYIALLAPEVRNQGAIIAHMGTVALAAGEAIDLKFDSNNRLTSLRVEPSQMAALVENKHAVQAPGGLVIISAQSMDRLVGGVVRNSGRIEATGLQQQGGRIMLSASTKVENTGSISANATAEGPAGKVEISAPEVVNSGSIGATGAGQHSAGSVLLQATNFAQTASGSIDLSAPTQGGQLKIQTTGNANLQGSVNAQATQERTTEGSATRGGQIDIAAQGDIEVNNATLDASGGQGGSIALRAKAPTQPDNPNPLPDAPGQGRLAIMGNSTLSTRGRSSQGGSTTLLGEHIELVDTTAIDATGATGGGSVLVGGDWQGGNGLYQATTVTMREGVTIDASATTQGNGGTVVLWSDVNKTESLTTAHGTVLTKGGSLGGNGGHVETSGHSVNIDNFKVDTRSASDALGKTGLWLIDPYDYTVDAAQAGTIGGNLNTSDVTVTTTVNNTSYGSSGNIASSGNITVNSAISKTGSATTTLTLAADNKINIYGDIGTSAGALNLVISTGAGLGGNMLSVGASVVSGTLSLGSGSLTKQGTGTLALTAANSYSGGTTVSAGTLGIYHNSSAGTGVIALGNNTTVLLGHAVTQVSNDWSLSGTTTIQLDTAADILVVGGGGGGGTRAGGGGGAGGVVQGEVLNWNNTYQITVGAGGSGAGACSTGGACTAPTAGTTSSIGLGGIFWLTKAYGGAFGGGYVNGSTVAGGTGNGSGGGGGGNGSLGGYGSSYGTDKSSGTAGGDSTTTTGGGGGGAGIDSSHYAYSSNSTTAGAGGAGTVSSITGSAQTYGGGGGGGAYTGLPAGAGGAGGGGAGGSASAGSNATANSGGGGGGGGYAASQNYAGGAGGSGLVVVRYLGGTAAVGGTPTSGTGSASGYTLHTFSTPGTYSLTLSPVAASLTGRISGSGHLQLNATGTNGTIGTGSTITLAGNNTYTGSTTIVGGTVTTAHAKALGNHTAVTVQSGSNLQLQNGLTAGSMAGSGDLQLGTYTLTTGGDNTSTSYAGTISGTGALLKTGTGIWTLSGSNTFSGGTTVNGGTLSVSADANLGAVPGSPTANALVLDGGTLLATASFTLDSNRGLQLSASGGTLNVASGTALAYGGVLNGSGNVGKLGAGTLTLSGSNTFTGNTTVSAGTLSVSADDNLGAVPSAPTANALVLDGGTLATTASFALGSNRGLQLGASGGALNVASGTILTYGGVLSGSGNLGKNGAGTLTLSGSNTYTGNTTVSAGTLSVSADDNLGAVPNAATANALVLDGGTLATTASFTLGSNRGLQLGASGGTVNVASGYTLTYGGVLNGSGNLGKLGAGTLSLSGSNTFTGNTTVSAGTLSVSADANLGAVPGTATANALVLNGGTLLATADFTLANNRGLQLGGSGGTVNVASGYTLTYGGAINGSGSFHLNPLGTGTLLLTGNNSYTGQTTIAAGELVFESNAPTLTSSDFTGPGTLVVRSAAASFSSPWTWSATTLSLGHLRLGRSGNTQTITLANGIDLTGNLLVNGPSQLGDYINTGGSQTYMGDVSISSPSVALNGKTDGTTGAGLVFAGNINGTTANSNSLFLHSGAGDISVAGHVGTGIALNALYLGGAGTLLPALTVNFAYTGGVQTFTAPRAGTYTLSTWGAAGGGLSYDVNSRAKGGYATGTYAMNAGDTLYVVVGGVGGESIAYKGTYGGYNGGGSSNWKYSNGLGPAGGGGATHIATTSGVLSSLDSSRSSILLVAGGGSGWSVETNGTAGGGNPGFKNAGAEGSSSPTHIESAGGGGGYYGGGIYQDFKVVPAGMNILKYGQAYGGTSFVSASLAGTTMTAGAGSTGDGSARIAIAGSSSFTPGNQTGAITIAGGLNVTQLNTASNMTGKLTLAGSTGNVSVTTPVTFNNTGPLQLGASSGASQSVAITGALVATAPSAVQLGANVTTSTASSAQSYGPVQLLRDVTLTTSNSELSFASTVDGSAANTESLTVATGTGNTRFSGAVGGSTALKKLTITTRTLTAAAIEASDLIKVTPSSASTISGVISGSTGLTVAGTSTLTLTGNNSYSGTTTISGGTLWVGSGGTTGTLGTGPVTDNAALVFNRFDTLTVANAISGTGSLTQSGSGTLVLTGSNSYGTTTISAGTLQVGNGGSTGTLGTGAVSNATALVFNRSGSLTVANTISGAGSLTQDGSGTLTLTQNNSYTGTTTINNGVLVLANDAPNPANKTFAGTGQLRIEPAGNDFTGAFSTSGWSFASTLSGLMIGKASTADGATDQAVSIDTATSIAGPITLYGGNITVNAGLVSTGTGFGAMVTLKGSGAVSDGANGYIQTSAIGAGNLLLLGGNVTLDSSSNSTWVLAANGVSGLTWRNSQALFIGSLSGVNGVSASGVVNICTQTGPLLLGQSIVTSNASNTALTLNASAGSSIGADLDKNILIAAGTTPSISVGSGGTARLFTGGVAGSTSLVSLNGLGAGSGRFRYNSDETSTNYTTALKTGLNVIYREQPTASVSNMALGMTYGDGLPEMVGTGQVNGDGSSGYTIGGATYSASGNLNATSGTPYTITPVLSALGYNVSAGSVTSGTLSVAKANATVTANSGTLTYNGANQTISGFTVSGLVGGETAAVLTGVSASLTKKNAGTYTVTPSGTDTNYNLSFVNGSMLIQPAPLTVTANNASKTYDAQPYSGGNGVSYSGFVGGESATALGGTVSYGGTAQGAKNAGSGYTLTPSGLSSNNYDITYVDGTLTINKANATVTANSGTLTYNGANQTVSGFTASGLVGGETAAVLTGVSAALTQKNAGTYTVTPSGTDTNYNLSFVNGSMLIQPAPLTVTANNASKTYDAQPYSGGNGVSYSGFVGGESATALGGTVSYGGTAQGAKNAGSGYTLTPSGLSSNNYAITYFGGTLAIIPAVISGALQGAVNKVYDGTMAATLDTANYALTGWVGQDGATVTKTSGTYDNANASSSKTVTVALSASDYSVMGTTNLTNYSLPTSISGAVGTISQAALTINATQVTKPYDGTLSAPGAAQVGPLATGDVINFTGTQAFTNKNVGSGDRTVIASGVTIKNGATNADVTGNYAITYVSNTTSTITPKALFISGITAADKVYDGQSDAVVSSAGVTAAVLQAGGLIAGDDVRVAVTGKFRNVSNTADDKNVGANKTVALTSNYSGTDVGNYAITHQATTTASITAKAVTLSAPTASRVYDGNTLYIASATDMAALTAALGVSGDTVSSITLNYDNKNVGTGKTLTASGAVISDGNGGGNYTITYATNTQSSVSRLNSVNWVGLGSTNNWFDPANWAGGAVPDLSNVANVVIPSGVNVSFDTAGAVSPSDISAAVSLNSIGTQGSLTQANGTLNIGTGGMILASYTQNGGTLTNTGTTALGSFSQSGGSFTGTGNISTGTLVQTGGTLSAGGNLTVTDGFSQDTSGSVSVAGITSITDTSGSVQLGNLSSTGTLTVTSTDGVIKQAAGTALTASVTSSFAASTGTNPALPADVLLTNSNNLVGAVSATAANLSLTNAQELTLGTVNATGDLTVISAGALDMGTSTVGGNLSADSGNGNITQAGALTVGGTSNLQAGTGNITLLNTGNDFTGAISAGGNVIQIYDKNALSLGTVNATGGLTVTSNGDLNLGTSTVGGNVSATSGNGNITQAGALTVSGTSNLQAGTGDITLLDTGNDFTGAVSAGGNDVQIYDKNALALSTVNTTGNLAVTSNGALDLGTSTIGGNLSATSGNGNITQAGAITVGGTGNLQAGTGNITLLNTGNDFTGAFSAGGNDVQIYDKNDLTLGTVSTTGNLAVTSNGALDLGTSTAGGILNANSGNGNITQGGALTVSGTSNLQAGTGNITLLNAGNDFTGAISAGGNDVQIYDKNALALSTVNTTGNLAVTSNGALDLGTSTIGGILNANSGNGNITQGGALTVGGTGNLQAGTGNITLLNAGNDFTGAISAGGNVVQIYDKNALTLGNVSVNDDLQVIAGGNINQDNANAQKIVVDGATSLTADGRVVLDGRDNKFTKGVTVKADSYTIEGDKRKSAGEAISKVMGSLPAAPSPATSLPNTQSPQPLVMTSSAATANSGSSSGSASGTGTATGSTNSAGVSVETRSVSQQDTPLMVAVSLPKGVSTVGAGFSFELPESVKMMATQDSITQIILPNGSPLPSWLKFDPLGMRFEASAVPDSALPLQVLAMIAGQRVTVVISERTE